MYLCVYVYIHMYLQVWRGALLLSDYILHQRELFSDCVAMELGAGVGLVSITLATVAKQVFCTGKIIFPVNIQN